MMLASAGTIEPSDVGRTPERLAFAHILRGIAAMSVVVSHYGYTFWRKPDVVGSLIGFPDLPRTLAGQTFRGVPDFGIEAFWAHFGVALFFLISGFVIPLSIVGKSRMAFALGRVLRIWPTYLAGLAVSLTCIAFNSWQIGARFPVREGEILAHAFILPRWPTLTRPIDGIIWTLEVELFFYGLCLVLMSPLRRLNPIALSTGVVCVPLAVLLGDGLHVLKAHGFLSYAATHWVSAMSLFASYMLIGTAAQYHYRGALNAGRLILIQLSLLAATTLSWRFGVLAGAGWAAPVSFLIAYIAFMLAYFSRRQIAALPTVVMIPFGRLADISYPLYVVHGILGYSILAHGLRDGLPVPVLLLIATSAAIFLALLMHIVIEKPSRAVGKSLAFRATKRSSRHRIWLSKRP